MELGGPLHPDRYSDDFARLCKAAGVPAIRLHDARHSCPSLLEKSGVPHQHRVRVGGPL